MSKTRYLQISNTTMMECILNTEETNVNNIYSPLEAFLLTRLSDNHLNFISSLNGEISLTDSSVYTVLPPNEIQSFNTINHLAIPKDFSSGSYYTFLDNNNEYIDNSILNDLNNSTNIKVTEYSKYLNISFDNKLFYYNEIIDIEKRPRWDTIRLYFTNGYDFSDIFGTYIKLYMDTNNNGYCDFCNLFYNKSIVYRYIQYLLKPIIYGNTIYDRYIDINIPSIYDLTVGKSNLTDLAIKMNLKINSPLKIQFAYIDEDSYTLDTIEYSLNNLVNTTENKKVSCSFSKSSLINGLIPVETLNSDNLGIYIAENPDYPYIEFCGTWKGAPLNTEIVQNFNKTIALYDQSYIKQDSQYEVDENYIPDYNLEKWIAVHEINFKCLDEDNIIVKEETYQMTQLFTTTVNEITKFYYRPVIFDEITINSVNTIIIDYLMRFVNVDDGVQFSKKGSLSIGIESIPKYYAKGTTLTTSDLTTYKVYNKIINNNTSLNASFNNNLKTKYIKVFYDVSSIILNGDNISDNGNYILTISPAPKNYKFVFLKKIDNISTYIDLSDGYYKLYTKDINNNDIILDPTYSDNMNIVLGELEYNLNINTISKLSKIQESNRTMSIVCYNSDGSISSFFDFKYTF